MAVDKIIMQNVAPVVNEMRFVTSTSGHLPFLILL